MSSTPATADAQSSLEFSTSLPLPSSRCTAEYGTVAACITACNESYEELKFCLETFHGQPPADLSLTTVYVFLDGCPDEDVQLKNETFQALSSLVGLHVPKGEDVFYEGGCRVYLGRIDKMQVRLYVKGAGDFQKSKRLSIVAFYDILAQRIASEESKEPVAVLHLDADTGSADSGRENFESGFGLENVAKMVRIMRSHENLGAIASQVRPFQRTKNALTLMQSFDCSTTYVGVFGGSSLIGRSVACFGMAVLYRYRALNVSKIHGVPSPLSVFSRTPDASIVDLVNLDMNEDQGMTTFILRAGYDTKVSIVTRFYTFAPETLTELMGQRRRWQAGYLVGMPTQVFGSPSPHLQLTKFRWLMAILVLIIWANMFILPGTIGIGLALIFDEAYTGFSTVVDGGFDHAQEHDHSHFRRMVFAACVWIFWLVFIVLTMDKPPKKIRGRCQLFFTVACVVSATVCFSAAIVSRSVQLFVCLSIGLNLVVGLALTFDPKEWPHRLQEALLYVVFLYVIQPMITMYAVANIDSALWGTRSVGNVNATAKSVTNAHATSQNSTGALLEVEGNKGASLHPSGKTATAGPTSNSVISLRMRKMAILLAWLFTNIGLTVLFLLLDLELVVVLNFFSNMVGLVVIVIAARIEARHQHLSALPPSMGCKGKTRKFVAGYLLKTICLGVISVFILRFSSMPSTFQTGGYKELLSFPTQNGSFSNAFSRVVSRTPPVDLFPVKCANLANTNRLFPTLNDVIWERSREVA